MTDKSVRVATNSVADRDVEVVRQWSVKVVPRVIASGERSYADGSLSSE